MIILSSLNKPLSTDDQLINYHSHLHPQVPMDQPLSLAGWTPTPNGGTIPRWRPALRSSLIVSSVDLNERCMRWQWPMTVAHPLVWRQSRFGSGKGPRPLRHLLPQSLAAPSRGRSNREWSGKDRPALTTHFPGIWQLLPRKHWINYIDRWLIFTWNKLTL